jgi:hypothetical protein
VRLPLAFWLRRIPYFDNGLLSRHTTRERAFCYRLSSAERGFLEPFLAHGLTEILLARAFSRNQTAFETSEAKHKSLVLGTL